MVTFSTRDSADELNKKFKTRQPRWHNFVEEPAVAINTEEFTGKVQYVVYVCDKCNAELEYNKIDDSLWCNTCVTYVNMKSAKKTVPFEIPVKQEDNTPLVSCGNTPGLDDVSIKHTPEPKGAFKMLLDKGLRITNYKEDILK